MKCFDCGSNLSEKDLQVASCQSCGEPLMPDDITTLREELGIAAAKPPEIINPIIESKPHEVPESIDCPGCFTPLIGIDLDAWNKNGCNYCSETNPEIIVSDNNQIPEDSGEDSDELKNSLPFIINLGPLVGDIIQLPIGEIGRADFHRILTDSWYQDHINRISSEHISIDENYLIIDLGSTNKTYIDGVRISGTSGTNLELGSDLNLGGNIQLTRVSEYIPSILIEHIESGVKWQVDPSTGENEDPVESQVEVSSFLCKQHLGRMNSSDIIEPWLRMADLQLRSMGKDEEILSYISRRHMNLGFNNHNITLDVFEGKENPSGWPTDDLSDFTLSLHKNTFRIIVSN